MSYTVRPISDRTVFTGKHQRSPFSASWSSTEALLLHEVRQLQGRDLVVECDVSESQIRIDGGLYARATPSTPAIRVAFASKHGPLSYATDRFWFWQDNIRAIALGLEALRRVDRYGITQHGEQYAGWRQIGSGPATPMGSGLGRDEAVRILMHAAGARDGLRWPADEPGQRRVYRVARANAHPDRRSGDRREWDLVETAARVLGLGA